MYMYCTQPPSATILTPPAAEVVWQWLPSCVYLVWKPSSMGESVLVTTATAVWLGDGRTPHLTQEATQDPTTHTRQDKKLVPTRQTHSIRLSWIEMTMATATVLLCIFGLGALLTGRVSASEHCSSCPVSWWYYQFWWTVCTNNNVADNYILS